MSLSHPFFDIVTFIFIFILCPCVEKVGPLDVVVILIGL